MRAKLALLGALFTIFVGLLYSQATSIPYPVVVPGQCNATQVSLGISTNGDPICGPLPNPGLSTLGGLLGTNFVVQHHFMTNIDGTGTQQSAQPACTDLSDSGTGCATNILRAQSGSLSGALTIGTCNTTTVSVTGATTSMAVEVSPVTNPDTGSVGLVRWDGYVSSSNTVTVRECGLGSVTPNSTAFNVAVIQ